MLDPRLALLPLRSLGVAAVVNPLLQAVTSSLDRSCLVKAWGWG